MTWAGSQRDLAQANDAPSSARGPAAGRGGRRGGAAGSLRSTWRFKVVVKDPQRVYTTWYTLCGLDFAVHTILEVQGRCNQARTVVMNH